MEKSDNDGNRDEMRRLRGNVSKVVSDIANDNVGDGTKASVGEIASSIKDGVIAAMARDLSNRMFFRRACESSPRLCDVIGVLAASVQVKVVIGNSFDRDVKDVYDERSDFGNAFIDSLRPYMYCIVNSVFMHRGDRGSGVDDALVIYIAEPDTKIGQTEHTSAGKEP